MTELGWMFFIFIGYHVASAVAWGYERRELVNKIMSRSYHEYEYAKNVGKTLRPDGEGQSIKEDEELPEDLAPIQNFGMN